jgi:two-component system, NtrC family, sensor kinase
VQLGQIVFNLLTNAVQAMGDGGGVVTIAAHEAGDQVIELRISDTGPGVAEGDREKIFEPLYTTKARGIGLGLAVSRALARANLGDLHVDGTPGGGATFIVTMPATDVAAT